MAPEGPGWVGELGVLLAYGIFWGPALGAAIGLWRGRTVWTALIGAGLGVIAWLLAALAVVYSAPASAGWARRNGV